MTTATKTDSVSRYLYLFTVFFLALSGFGQMPIFKRYYIADIPGLGWLAKFYITHYIHYLGAILLLALCAYYITDYFMFDFKKKKLTFSGYFKTAVIAGLMLSGFLLVIKNFADYHLPNGLIIFLYLFHLILVMLLLGYGFYSLIAKKCWMANRPDEIITNPKN
jgi:hypothetical protein